jgi:hypothetical protein
MAGHLHSQAAPQEANGAFRRDSFSDTHELARISSHQCAFFAAKWHIRIVKGKEGLSVRGLTTAASIRIAATCAVAAQTTARCSNIARP